MEFGQGNTVLEAHPEMAFREIRESKTKGLWFKKRPKTLFRDASLGAEMQTPFVNESSFVPSISVVKWVEWPRISCGGGRKGPGFGSV